MAPLILIDRPERDLSPEGMRASALQELKTPATCRVPRTWDDIRYTDWLLRFTDECGLSLDIICLPLAITGFIVDAIYLIGTGTGALPIAAAGAVASFLPAYLYFLSHGQLPDSGPVSSFFTAIRIARIRRRDLRRGRRAARRLDARSGWRPREGIPHPKGRTDTFGRYLVEAHATDLGVVLGLRYWCCDEHRIWMPTVLRDARWFDDGTDGTELANYQVELEGHVPALEKQEQEALTTGRAEQEFTADQMRPRQALVEHINGQAVARI